MLPTRQLLSIPTSTCTPSTYLAKQENRLLLQVDTRIHILGTSCFNHRGPVHGDCGLDEVSFVRLENVVDVLLRISVYVGEPRAMDLNHHTVTFLEGV